MCNFDVVEELKEEQIIMDHKKINSTFFILQNIS